MRFLLRARTLAAAAVTTGAVVLGLAVGGLASVDRELTAATAAPAPAARDLRVVYEIDPAQSVADCPERGKDRDAGTSRHSDWPEL